MTWVKSIRQSVDRLTQSSDQGNQFPEDDAGHRHYCSRCQRYLECKYQTTEACINWLTGHAEVCQS